MKVCVCVCLYVCVCENEREKQWESESDRERLKQVREWLLKVPLFFFVKKKGLIICRTVRNLWNRQENIIRKTSEKNYNFYIDSKTLEYIIVVYILHLTKQCREQTCNNFVDQKIALG